MLQRFDRQWIATEKAIWPKEFIEEAERYSPRFFPLSTLPSHHRRVSNKFSDILSPPFCEVGGAGTFTSDVFIKKTVPPPPPPAHSPFPPPPPLPPNSLPPPSPS